MEFDSNFEPRHDCYLQLTHKRSIFQSFSFRCRHSIQDNRYVCYHIKEVISLILVRPYQMLHKSGRISSTREKKERNLFSFLSRQAFKVDGMGRTMISHGRWLGSSLTIVLLFSCALNAETSGKSLIFLKNNEFPFR